jgi:hypothetical protein
VFPIVRRLMYVQLILANKKQIIVQSWVRFGHLGLSFLLSDKWELHMVLYPTSTLGPIEPTSLLDFSYFNVMERLLGNNQKDGKVSLPSFVTFGKAN